MKKLFVLFPFTLLTLSPLLAQEKIFLADGVAATATLRDPADPGEAAFQRTGRYSVRNLRDGDPATWWAAGKGGVGVRIYLALPRAATAVVITNGAAGDAGQFAANNRLRDVRVFLYAGFSTAAQVTEIRREFVAVRLKDSRIISLKDGRLPQTLSLPFEKKKIAGLFLQCENAAAGWLARRPDGEELRKDVVYNLILCLEIRTLFKGNKFNNTCLAELGFVAPAEIAAADLAGGWRPVASDLDCEDVLFSIEADGSRPFSSFLHERPFDDGEWKLENGRLTITTGRFTSVYTGLTLRDGVLRFYNAAGEEQRFEKIR